MCNNVFLASLILSTISCISRADILFIDFNLNDKEIVSAQKIADQHGEKLVVFPNVSVKDRHAFKTMEESKAAITERLKVCSYDLDCTKKALEQFAILMDQQKLLLSKTSFGAAELSQFLQQMDREGRSFSTFIESGHAGAERFDGVFAKDITHEDLARIVAGKSSLQSVKYVLYWGCYTMTLGAIKNRWPKIFPAARLVAGFDDLGPLARLY